MSNEQFSLAEMTLRQLRSLANAYGILHYSRMRKAQLMTAIEAMRGRQEASPQSNRLETQEVVEAAKFDVGQPEPINESLASIDEGLPGLPDGYGESRIVLMPRDPQWAYAYWDIPNEHKDELRRQGGLQLALRLYDVTNVNLDCQSPHSIQEAPTDELAREWYLPIPVSDRDYVVDIGYRCADGRWLVLARSAAIRIPAVYPSDWFDEQFITIDWDEDLQGKTFLDLGTPKRRGAIHQKLYELTQETEAPHVAGSLFASRQMVPEQAFSSYVFPSGMGMWSGVGMSGVGMSGIGFFASMPSLRPRKFWLIADAELIVYGATEPDATVTVGGDPIQLSSDGTFRFQMSFQDGLIDYPIMAVAADGEQNRAIHMKFTRETPERRTNAKEEAFEELMLLANNESTSGELLSSKEWVKKFEAKVPEDFQAKVLQKYSELAQVLNDSPLVVELTIHKSVPFIEKLDFHLPPKLEDKFAKAVDSVKELLKQRSNQVALCLKLTDQDLNNTSKVAKVATQTLFPAILEGKPKKQLEDNSQFMTESIDTIAVATKVIQTNQVKEFLTDLRIQLGFRDIYGVDDDGFPV